MTTVNIKQNDTKGIFSDTLTVDGVPVNLTGCTVKFLLRKPGIAVISQTATVAAALTGDVTYQPVLADVSKVGKYQQEWEVTFGDNRILTFPNGGYNTVIIGDDLG
jgi:hypothetical protein